MKPLVGIDCERTKYFHTGLGQFCYQLATQFIAHSSEYSWAPHFLLPPHTPLHVGHSSHQFAQAWQKLLGLRKKANLWHVTHQDSEYWPKRAQRILLTIHDLNFLSEKSAHKAKLRLRNLQNKVDRADAISVISEFTRKEVETHLTLRADQKIHVIYNGAELNTDVAPLRPSHAVDAPFFFTLGVVRPKKNFHVLLEMMTLFPHHHLFIGGSLDHSYAQVIEGKIKEFHLEDRIHLVGTVEAAHKAWFYQHCEAFLFPSLLEGFGIPVIEAMHWGKSVICSNKTSLPEVGGACAHYWSSFEPVEMAQVVRLALAERERAPEEVSRRNQRHAQQFTWARAASQYAQLYQSLL